MRGTKKPAGYLNALPTNYRLDEYEFRDVLGAGGFGITYRGFDHHLIKTVAIKEYLPNDLAVRRGVSVLAKSETDQDDFEWGLERFLDEARVLARFDHQNIIHVYRYFQAHGTGYIVMEYADGETLSDLLDRKGTLLPDELKRLLFPLLDGLEEVHRGDYLHRDIKPGNIIVREDGSPVILDFGAARQAINAKSRSVTAIVTPGYAPIEQYSTRGNQGPWTDIYALAAVVSRAMTGEKPADATERIHETGDKNRLAARTKGIWDPGFIAAIECAFHFKEEDRPQSIAEWRSLLLGGEKSEMSLNELPHAGAKLEHDDASSSWRPQPLFSQVMRDKRLYFGGIAAVVGVLALGSLLYELVEPFAGNETSTARHEPSFEIPPTGLTISPSELQAMITDLDKQSFDAQTDEHVQALRRRIAEQIETHIVEGGLELASELLDVGESQWSNDPAFRPDSHLHGLLSDALEERAERREVDGLVATAKAWLGSDPSSRVAIGSVAEVIDNLNQAIDVQPDNEDAHDTMDGVRHDRVSAIRAALDGDNLPLAEKLVKDIEGKWPGDKEVEGVRTDVQQRATIERLLVSADNLLRQGRLTLGERNAMSEFHAVLRLDPNNEQGSLGLRNVEARLATLVDESVDDESLDAARQHLRSLSDMNPSHPELEALRKRIDEAENRLSSPPTGTVVQSSEATSEPDTTETVMRDDEDRLWNSVKDSCREGDLQRYLKTYPRGRYKNDAWAKMSACSKAVTTNASR